ncbi:hypothetical protein FHS68_003053 [Dyadobacter arcticus]|uniref:Uncharacterized protein n=1 Tax=Dyadobacter arcticus TaxID=1078754 RepID=A0ABX0USA9_9BACT|nr:hypothetical protein [Dyadobacter arcticus]
MKTICIAVGLLLVNAAYSQPVKKSKQNMEVNMIDQENNSSCRKCI